MGIPARLAAATGPDRSLDSAIACALVFRDLRPALPDDFNGEYGYSPGNIKCRHGFLMADSYTRSTDDAIAIVERVLPGWRVEIDSGDPTLAHAKPRAKLTPHNRNDDGWRIGISQEDAASVPLAILRALFAALDAKAALAKPGSSVVG